MEAGYRILLSHRVLGNETDLSSRVSVVRALEGCLRGDTYAHWGLEDVRKNNVSILPLNHYPTSLTCSML